MRMKQKLLQEMRVPLREVQGAQPFHGADEGGRVIDHPQREVIGLPLHMERWPR